MNTNRTTLFPRVFDLPPPPPSQPLERERRGEKKTDPGNEDADRSFFPFTIIVFVSSGENRSKELRNIGSIFLQIKTLSNSLGTGMDKLDGVKDVLPSQG